jgi:hypothetical protein
MTDEGGIQADETAPIAATLPPASQATEARGRAATPLVRQPAPTSMLPVVVPPPTPVLRTAAGWYPLNGEQRYWDGLKWTEHRAPLVIDGRVIAMRRRTRLSGPLGERPLRPSGEATAYSSVRVEPANSRVRQIADCCRHLEGKDYGSRLAVHGAPDVR